MYGSPPRNSDCTLVIEIDTEHGIQISTPHTPAPGKVTFFFQENEATIQPIMTCG